MQALLSILRWCQGGDVTTFNARARWAAALWLVVTIPLGVILRPTGMASDFPQFYMGGGDGPARRVGITVPHSLV